MPPKTRSLAATATAAARAALEAKAELIGVVADAQATVDQLKAKHAAAEQRLIDQLAALRTKHESEVADAEAKHASAYQAAVDGGWKATEITGFNLRLPAARTARPTGRGAAAAARTAPVAPTVETTPASATPAQS